METTNEVRKADIPPYVAYRTFINLLETFRVAIPARIDRSVLPNISGGVYASLLCSIRMMKLVDSENVPTPEFEKLVNSQDEDRKSLLRALFNRTYAYLEDNGLNLSQITLDQLNKVFGQAGASGTTVKKCRSFFLSFAKDAGIDLSPFLKRAIRKTTASKSRPSRQTKKTEKPSDAPEEQIISERQSFSDVLYEILDPEVMSEEEQKAVWTLMLYLKKQEAIDE